MAEPVPTRAGVQDRTGTNAALPLRTIPLSTIRQHCLNQNISCLFKNCERNCLYDTNEMFRYLLQRHLLCVRCWKKVSVSEHEMHMRGKHRVKLQCPFCNQQGETSRAIISHIGHMHGGRLKRLSFRDIAQHIGANIPSELQNSLKDEFISDHTDFGQPDETITGQGSSYSIQEGPQYGFCPSVMRDFFKVTCLFKQCRGCWGTNGPVQSLTQSITRHAICVKCLYQGSEKSHADSCSQQKILCCLCHKPFSSGGLLKHMRSNMHSAVDNELIKNEMRKLLKNKLRPEDYACLHESLKITDVTNDAFPVIVPDAALSESNDLVE